MAIVLDQQLGTAYETGDQTDIALTTGAAVASGGFIVLGVGGNLWPSDINISSVSGGGLTWTVDHHFHIGTQDGFAIISAQAPAGLASSTVVTISFSGGTGVVAYPICGGVSFTGVKTSSPVDGTPLSGGAGSGTSWSSGSYAITAGSVLVGGVYINSGDSHNATAGTECWDRNNGGGPSSAGIQRIESSAGSYNLAGSWTGSSGYGFAAVAYLAAAGGGGGDTTIRLRSQYQDYDYSYGG
jgi:hypothetical protein